jgi:hypothetical protein
MYPRLALVLSCCALLGTVPAHAQLSPETRAKIMSSFPAYHPNPPEEKKPVTVVGEPAPLSDDPLVRLPRYYVEETRLAEHDPDRLLTVKGRDQKAMREYRASMNPLEWMLNSWHIPFLTPSAQARANADYFDRRQTAEARRLSDLQALPDH